VQEYISSKVAKPKPQVGGDWQRKAKVVSHANSETFSSGYWTHVVGGVTSKKVGQSCRKPRKGRVHNSSGSRIRGFDRSGIKHGTGEESWGFLERVRDTAYLERSKQPIRKKTGGEKGGDLGVGRQAIERGILLQSQEIMNKG